MVSKKHVPSTASIYIFKVALKDSKTIWRRIAIRGDQTLDDLHEAIYAAFDRYDEHLYSFYFFSPGAPNARGRRRLDGATEYGHPMADSEYNAAETEIGTLRLKKGQKFEYLFDFGDSWWHELTVEDVAGKPDGGDYPRVIESQGKSPPQYPDMDDDDE